MNDNIKERFYYSIGIDMGNTNSSIGFFSYNKEVFKNIQNSNGHKHTPLYVSFTKSNILFGEDAKQHSIIDPKNTIYDIKHLIDRKFSDPNFQKEMKAWPFKVVCGDADNPLIEVEYKGKPKQFSPEVILSMFFTYLKETAEAQLTPKNKYKKVQYASIAVPAYYTKNQCKIIERAAESAGLKIYYVNKEPLMTCVALDLKDTHDERNILILDLGGKTFDVSFYKNDFGLFEIISSASEILLGGNDFDNRMMNYFADRFQEKYSCDLRQSRKATQILNNACEKAKIALSKADEVPINCDSLFEGHNLNDIISRSAFETINDDLFESLLSPIEKVLNDANVNKNDKFDVVFVGGSSNIPKIKEIIQNFFNDKKVIVCENPDETVAKGTAITSSLYKNYRLYQEVDVLVIKPFDISVGIGTSNGIKNDFFKINEFYCYNTKKLFTTSRDYQKKVVIKVLEGERLRSNDCNLIDEFEFELIEPNLRGVPEIEISLHHYSFHNHQFYKVIAKDLSTGNYEKWIIDYDRVKLSKSNREKAISDAKKYKIEDNEIFKKVKLRNQLEFLCIQFRKEFLNEKFALLSSDTNRGKMICEVDNVFEWIDLNENANETNYESQIEKMQNKMKLFFQNEEKNVSIPKIDIVGCLPDC